MVKVVTYPFGYKYGIQCTNCKSVLEFFLADEVLVTKYENGVIKEDCYCIVCPVCGGTIITRYADGEDFRISDKK